MRAFDGLMMKARRIRVALGLGLASQILIAAGISAAIFVVVNPADSGPGSLRDAITTANTNPGPDTITFDIPPAAGNTILLQSELPDITEALTIDGYTQPGASPNTLTNGNDATILIQLSGFILSSGNGFHLKSSGSTVRGLAIIGFANGGTLNNGDAVFINGGDSNAVEGCFLGLDLSGTNGLPNLRGVEALGGTGNRIGGATPGQRNVIANSQFDGVLLTTSTGTLLTGNFIGTDASGSNGLGNASNGALLQDAPGNTVTGNLIAGNASGGLLLQGLGASNNVVAGNTIGTAAVPNVNFGVRVSDGSANSISNNVIAFNTGPGVSILTGTGNAILGNSIFNNAALGINLFDDGVTPNDPLDADTGPNNFQNFPVLDSAGAGAATIVIAGTIPSAPNQNYRIEFFASPKCDAFGNGQGQTFLGTAFVTTDSSGNGLFNVTLPAVVSIGNAITATATDGNGNTSEFSACVTNAPLPCAADITSQVVVRLTKVRLNARTSRCFQRVTIVNPTDSEIDISPLYLALDNLTPNVTLLSRTGDTSCALPLGSPFVVVTSSNLKGHHRVRTMLVFTTKTKKCITFTPRVLAGSVKP
jgi:parallel beta-helix repeat protein